MHVRPTSASARRRERGPRPALESLLLPLARRRASPREVPPGADVSAPALPPPRLHGLLRFVPALAVLRGYGPHDARADAVSGLTVAAVAVPQAMAYAMVAGLPPETGLYTAIVMTFVGALFD